MRGDSMTGEKALENIQLKIRVITHDSHMVFSIALSSRLGLLGIARKKIMHLNSRGLERVLRSWRNSRS